MKHTILGIITFLFITTLCFAENTADTAMYAAKAVFEFKTPAGEDAQQAIRAHLPMNSPDVSLFANTSNLFELTIKARDPEFAAKRANDLITGLEMALNDDKGHVIKIWKKAEPPLTPIKDPVNVFTESTKPLKPLGLDITSIYGQMYDGLYSYLAKPETTAKLAKFQRSYYEALVKEGFSKDEALKIITSSTLPATQYK